MRLDYVLSTEVWTRGSAERLPLFEFDDVRHVEYLEGEVAAAGPVPRQADPSKRARPDNLHHRNTHSLNINQTKPHTTNPNLLTKR